jgi:hypothetical protein
MVRNLIASCRLDFGIILQLQWFAREIEIFHVPIPGNLARLASSALVTPKYQSGIHPIGQSSKNEKMNSVMLEAKKQSESTDPSAGGNLE